MDQSLYGHRTLSSTDRIRMLDELERWCLEDRERINAAFLAYQRDLDRYHRKVKAHQDTKLRQIERLVRKRLLTDESPYEGAGPEEFHLCVPPELHVDFSPEATELPKELKDPLLRAIAAAGDGRRPECLDGWVLQKVPFWIEAPDPPRHPGELTESQIVSLAPSVQVVHATVRLARWVLSHRLNAVAPVVPDHVLFSISVPDDDQAWRIRLLQERASKLPTPGDLITLAEAEARGIATVVRIRRAIKQGKITEYTNGLVSEGEARKVMPGLQQRKRGRQPKRRSP